MDKVEPEGWAGPPLLNDNRIKQAEYGGWGVSSLTAAGIAFLVVTTNSPTHTPAAAGFILAVFGVLVISLCSAICWGVAICSVRSKYAAMVHVAGGAAAAGLEQTRQAARKLDRFWVERKRLYGRTTVDPGLSVLTGGVAVLGPAVLTRFTIWLVPVAGTVIAATLGLAVGIAIFARLATVEAEFFVAREFWDAVAWYLDDELPTSRPAGADEAVPDSNGLVPASPSPKILLRVRGLGITVSCIRE